MGLDIAGATIVKNASAGVSLNSLVFNSVGQGSSRSIPGYSGYKSGGSTYYGAPTGWEINAANWQSGINLSNGVFTCPVAGWYALGYNGIHKGGSGLPAGYSTFGYSGFMKNGALSYWVHWNQGSASDAVWNTGGASAVFLCAAGDTLALSLNRAPAGTSDAVSQNYGMYPDAHHAVWCKLIG
jgi:hypothetical protein